MAVCHSGDPDRAGRDLAPIRAIGGPVFDLVGPMPDTHVQSYLDDTEPKGRHYDWKTEFLAGLDDGLLTWLPELFAGCPNPEADIGLLHLGGALNERPGDDGAVGNRDARYVVGVKGMWAPGEPEADRYRQWVRDAWSRPSGAGTRAICSGPTATSVPERAVQPRSRDGSAWTGSPSTRVATTRASPTGPAAASNGSRSRTARSASLPGVTEPVSASRRRA
jgi:hypothetical protein